MAMDKLKLFGVLILSLYLIVPLTSATATEVDYCNKKSNYAVEVSGVDITPFPISKGKTTTFSIAASTDKAITGGKLIVDVYYIFGIHVFGETFDLCSETSCPVSAGDFVVAHSQELPSYTPPGSYTIKMTMKDENDKQLTCISFDFSIGFLEEEEVNGVADS